MDRDFVTGLFFGFIGGFVTFFILYLLFVPGNEPPLSDYRKIETCERILRAELRVADFLDCLANNGLRIVEK